MDEHTLQGLIAAYRSAPSPDLAKILALALVREGRADEARDYLSAVRSAADDDAETLTDAALSLDMAEQALEFLDPAAPRQAALIARCQRALEPACDDGSDAPRPRLRVVEKTDVHDISDILDARQPTISFDDVIGLNDVKKQIDKKIILPFQKPSLYQRFRKKIGGGVMLYGPPGCGKTLIARATAGQCRAQFHSVQITDVLDMYIGESERKLQLLMEQARSETPSVLFFDEIEALAGKREHARNSSTANLVSLFLSELDGVAQNNQGLLVLAATNTPWAVDPAFLRPGRFDRLFFVPPPDRDARLGILRAALAGRPCHTSLNLEPIAKKTAGFSGADLVNLVDAAADEAIDASIASGEETPIDDGALKTALADVRPTTGEWLNTARNYARYANDAGRYNDVLDFLKRHGR